VAHQGILSRTVYLLFLEHYTGLWSRASSAQNYRLKKNRTNQKKTKTNTKAFFPPIYMSHIYPVVAEKNYHHPLVFRTSVVKSDTILGTPLTLPNHEVQVQYDKLVATFSQTTTGSRNILWKNLLH